VQKWDFNYEVSLFATRLQINAIKLRHEDKYKKLVDTLLAELLTEGFELENEEQSERLLDVLLSMVLCRKEFEICTRSRSKELFEASSMLVSENNEFKAEDFFKRRSKTWLDELPLMAKEGETFERRKDAKYKELTANFMQFKTEKKIYELGWEYKFWKENDYKELIYKLSFDQQMVKEDELQKEQKYKMLVTELLAVIYPTVTFQFWIEEMYNRFVDILLPKLLEIEGLRNWQEKCEILVVMLTQILEVEVINEILKKEEHSMLIFELKKLISKTPEEVGQGCVRIYTMDGVFCSQINQFLREADETTIEESSPFVCLLYCYFDHPSSIEIHSIEVYRGMNLLQSMIEDYKEAAKHGGSYRWAGFSSTSKCRDVAEIFGNNTLFIMHLRKVYQKRKNAIDISRCSQFPDEEEVLLKSGVEYTVRKVEYDEENERHYIYLNVYV